MVAILLVDQVSRLNSTIEIAELKRFNISIISDLKELLTMGGSEKIDCPVVVLDGFIQSETGISELVLFQRMIGVEYVFISSNEVLLRQMERYAKTFALNTEQINYNLILAAVNDDVEAYKPFMAEPNDRFTQLARMIIDNQGIMDPVQKEMASYLLNLTEDNKRLHQALIELQEIYDKVHGMNENKAGQVRYLSDLVDVMLSQTVAVNEALSKYSFICQKDVYKKVSLSEFKHRPHIIYFKEYRDFLHLDTFIHTLAESFKKQHDIPVKVLWILDKNDPLKLKFIPKYYTIYADGVYSKPAIHISDYMCTTSGYDGIIQAICENQSGAEYLIIVDSKLVDDTVVPISETLRYDLCRSASKIRAYGLLDSRTIVNNEEDRDLSWNHLYDYHDLTPEDRFLYFSNRPVIRTIIRSAQREFALS